MRIIILLLLNTLIACDTEMNETNQDPPTETSVYFPPINSNEWETHSQESLNWDTNKLQDLVNYLDQKSTKSFMILYRGRIVVESYFNGHTSSSPWYWASAGKTLTTAITGIAQAEGFIDINQQVSNYMGTGWTSAPPEKEAVITCKNLLNMTSGLDDSAGDGIAPSDLNYVADAGTRWAYHNVYVKLQDVVSSAANQTWNNYFNQKLRDKIGMGGAWIQNNDLNVYWSNTRSMARFGLLISNEGNWNGTQIIPQNFLNEVINTSQNLNEAYGYMWWLNGKSSYRLPQTQVQFNGSLIPNAPNTMYCALGKNDQKIYIIPDRDLVIVRMGEAADNQNFALSNFDNELWGYINEVIN